MSDADLIFKLAGVRTSATGTFTEADIEKMRKDILTLTKNVDRVKDYEDSDKLRRAMATWRKHFEGELAGIRDELALTIRVWLTGDTKWKEWMADQEKQWFDYWDKKLRTETWDLVISLSPPIADAEWEAKKWDTTVDRGKELSFVRWEREKKVWAEKLKRVARKAWKVLTEFLEWVKGKNVPVRKQVVERYTQRMEGFSVTFEGMEQGSEYHQRALTKFEHALKLYRQRASQVAPFLLRSQLPLVFSFQCPIDLGGRYEGDHIVICASSDSKMQAKTLAHEMGHHVYKGYLSSQDREFWHQVIYGDYGDLDLRELLREWQPTESLLDLEERLQTEDPVLYLQVDGVFTHSQANKLNIHDREDLEQYLSSGKDPVVRVPKHPITAYATKNEEEAFCETIGLLVAYGPKTLDPRVVYWLRTILPSEVKVASSEERVAALFMKTAGYFNVGDVVVFGKYKNKKAIVRAITIDERGVPVVTLEPVPKGRKQDKTIGLFNIWHADPEKRKTFGV